MIVLLATACEKADQQALSFSVLVTASSFREVSPPQQEPPNLMVIASREEIVPPIAEYSFPDNTLDQLDRINFDTSFAIMFMVGQIANAKVISEITRANEQVFIKLADTSVGPGNYILEGYSTPYQLVAIEKAGNWNQDIEFILEDENGNQLVSTTHYIP
jgi:hypothetical protein